MVSYTVYVCSICRVLTPSRNSYTLSSRSGTLPEPWQSRFKPIDNSTVSQFTESSDAEFMRLLARKLSCPSVDTTKLRNAWKGRLDDVMRLFTPLHTHIEGKLEDPHGAAPRGSAGLVSGPSYNRFCGTTGVDLESRLIGHASWQSVKTDPHSTMGLSCVCRISIWNNCAGVKAPPPP